MIREHYEAIQKKAATFWWYVARRDLFTRLLAKHPAPSRELALDVGCGPASNALLYPALASRVLSVDSEASVFKEWPDRGGNGKVVGSALGLPVKDASADALLLLDVLEHLPEEGPALGELFRVLRPGGLALISVPALQSLWGWHDEQAHHYRRYRLSRIRSLVEGAGFEILEAHYFNFLLAPPIWAIRKVCRWSGASKNKIEMNLSPSALNGLFSSLLILENRTIARGFHLPFGSSAVVLGRRPAGAAASPAPRP